MKTPEDILIQNSPTPAAGYHSSWIIAAMKEYAKQWLSQAAKGVEMYDDERGIPSQVIYRIMDEIDAQ